MRIKTIAFDFKNYISVRQMFYGLDLSNLVNMYKIVDLELLRNKSDKVKKIIQTFTYI